MNVVWPPPATKCSVVVRAAEALGISEYDFFRLAFRRWSGREADNHALEQAFVAYMFHQSVPAWVRHLSREVLEQLDTGTLDPEAFGVSGFKRRYPLPRLGRFSWRLMAGVMVILLLMSLDTTYVRNPSVPMGCPGATGSMFFDRLAQFFKGGPNHACPALPESIRDDRP
ncbi:MAG: hypothetical protein ACE5GT_08605 [Rhodospirillales bacterium]